MVFLKCELALQRRKSLPALLTWSNYCRMEANNLQLLLQYELVTIVQGYLHAEKKPWEFADVGQGYDSEDAEHIINIFSLKKTVLKALTGFFVDLLSHLMANKIVCFG